jgi:hypothetical protein
VPGRRLPQRGELVDDRVGVQAVDGAEQAVALQGIRDHGGGAERLDPVRADRVPGQAEHLVAVRHQLAGDGDADRAGCAGEQDLHAFLLRRPP